MKLCPDDETWHRFFVGDVSPDKAKQLERHLNQCDACAARAATIPAKDALVEAFAAKNQVNMEEDQSAILRAVSEGMRINGARDTGEFDETLRVEISSHTENSDFLLPAQESDELGRLGGYRVLEVLGEGGMGIVFRAEDPTLQREVALKVMRPNISSAPRVRERFLSEARATASIDHDHVVTIHQVGEDNGVPFIAMQLLRGESLKSRLSREGSLDHAEALRIAREIAAGLEAAHAHGLIHRDIKPDNIWLESSGRCKVLDFGLVRVSEDTGLTQTGVVLGTPGYMSPEQVDGDPVDHRSDLFSLGTLIYRMVAGKSPFEGRNVTSVLMAVANHDAPPLATVAPEVDPILADVVERLLSKNRDDRHDSAAAVIAELSSPARPKTQSQRTQHTRRLKYQFNGWIAGGLVALGIIVLLKFKDGGSLSIESGGDQKSTLTVDLRDSPELESLTLKTSPDTSSSGQADQATSQRKPAQTRTQNAQAGATLLDTTDNTRFLAQWVLQNNGGLMFHGVPNHVREMPDPLRDIFQIETDNQIETSESIARRIARLPALKGLRMKLAADVPADTLRAVLVMPSLNYVFFYVPPSISFGTKLEQTLADLKIRVFGMKYPKMTAADLVSISSNTHIENLTLSIPNLTDEDLEPLTRMKNLKQVYLYDAVRVDGIAVFKNMSQLQTLHMWSTQLTDKQVNELQDSLPKCDMWPLRNR